MLVSNENNLLCEGQGVLTSWLEIVIILGDRNKSTRHARVSYIFTTFNIKFSFHVSKIAYSLLAFPSEKRGSLDERPALTCFLVTKPFENPTFFTLEAKKSPIISSRNIFPYLSCVFTSCLPF